MFLVIICCFSFAQKKILVAYTTGHKTILFYDDNTFLHKKGPLRSLPAIGYLDPDTISYGNYIKEREYYIVQSAKEVLNPDSFKNIVENDNLMSYYLLYERYYRDIAYIINKKKIVFNNTIYWEWDYLRKKEKRDFRRYVWQRKRHRSFTRRYNKSLEYDRILNR